MSELVKVVATALRDACPIGDRMHDEVAEHMALAALRGARDYLRKTSWWDDDWYKVIDDALSEDEPPVDPKSFGTVAGFAPDP